MENERAALAAADTPEWRAFCTLPELGHEYGVAEGAAAPILWTEGCHSLQMPGESSRSIPTTQPLAALVKCVVDVAKAGGKVYVEDRGWYRLEDEHFVLVPPQETKSPPMRAARAVLNQLLHLVRMPT